MSDFETIAAVADIPPGESKSVFVDDVPVLVVNVEGTFYAIEDACSHDGQPLEDGPVNGSEVTCPRHGARFDVKTGKVLSMPAASDVQAFPVKVEGGQILVSPEPAEFDDCPVEEPAGETQSAAATEGQGDAADSGLPEGHDEILTALKQVTDPELHVNIVDLGLVYEIDRDGGKIDMQMMLTSPACPEAPKLMQDAKQALLSVDGVDEANVQLIMTPPWTPERMTDDARDELGIF